MRRQAPVEADRFGVAVRVAIGEQEEVRPGLRAVADAVRGEVAKPFRHPPEHERCEPAEERAGTDHASERSRQPRLRRLDRSVRRPRSTSCSPSPRQPRAPGPGSRAASRRAIFQRLCGAGPGISTSTGYPGSPVKPGYGFAARTVGVQMRRVADVRRRGTCAARSGAGRSRARRTRSRSRRRRPRSTTARTRRGAESRAAAGRRQSGASGADRRRR